MTVHAEAATWDSTVFAVTVGSAVRYLEVPAERVPAFLDSVDRGELDADLVALATTPTGAALDLPGRVRRLAAFDRLVRGAVAQAERDPMTGELTGSGWRPRKRRRDEQHGDQQNGLERHGGERSKADSSPGSSRSEGLDSAGAGAGGTSVPAAVVAHPAWWSGGAAAVAAVSAVVVLAAVVIFVVARSGSDAGDGSGTVAAPPPVAVTSSVAASGAATTAGTNAGPAVSGTAAVTTAAVPAAPTTGDRTASGGPAAAAPPASAAGASTSPAQGSPTATARSSPQSASSSQSARSSAPAGAAGAGNPLAGKYAFTRTVTANNGNTSFPVGKTDSGTLELSADCDAPTCAVTLVGGDVGKRSGNQLAFAGTEPEPCPADPSITSTDSWTLTLKPAGETEVDGVRRVAKFTGTGTLTVSDSNGCRSEVAPVAFKYTGTRAD